MPRGKVAIAPLLQVGKERLHVAVPEVRQKMMHGLARAIAIAFCDRVTDRLVDASNVDQFLGKGF